MRHKLSKWLSVSAVISGLIGVTVQTSAAQTITHQIALPPGNSWCADSMIYALLAEINAVRAQRNFAALQMDAVGMKDAEMRAVQFSQYMATAVVGSPGFNPHQGYDTTAASLGYDLVGENLAYMTSDPKYIVLVLWQDPLHLAAMLSTRANVAGVSCLYVDGIPYWTYEPGYSRVSGSPAPQPPASQPVLDAEQWAFLALINKYRAENGAGPLEVSVALQNAAQWMSSDMAAKNYIAHTDSLGRNTGARIAAFNYTYFPWGENIAAGYPDAQNTFEQWRTACDPDTSGACTYAHRKNMLNPGFAVIGIGRASGSSMYGWYWTTDFGGYVDLTISQDTPPGVQAPVISAFTATPSAIAQGQATTLSWTVSGAPSLSIDNGVGAVSGSSRSVSPAQTTTYRLTATSSAGSSTASFTVTVNAAARDTQPPSAAAITSVTAESATQIDVVWAASTDNVGVTGYQILRNGSVLTSVPGATVSYSDRSVSPSTTYSYSVKSYDAAGNYSTAVASVQVTTPAAGQPPTGPPSTACPEPATNAFTACYYNNTDLSGTPALVRTDDRIQFDWGTGTPAAAITPFNFSARWQGYFSFEAAEYAFTTTASDGLRLYIDGQIVLDRWRDQPAYMYVVRRTLTAGPHLVTVEYYERTGLPTARVSWQKSSR